MIIIGEKINGMFKKVSSAIKERNEEFIQNLAQQQIFAGADVLDVNVGPESVNPTEDLVWLIKTLRKITNVPLAIDTTKLESMQEGLSYAGEGAFINSSHADEEKLDVYIPLAKKYNSKLIVLTISKNGVPQDIQTRLELALNIIKKCQEYNFDISNLFIDPVLLPINVAQQQIVHIIDFINQIKFISEPPPRTILGLSNISQGTKYRSLIDRTFISLAIYAGLDAAILNPLDKDLMDTIITTELLLNKQLYCESFLEAYRKK
ncbi:MAG: dihydropteroate synthase [Endomicrobiia bacterium]